MSSVVLGRALLLDSTQIAILVIVALLAEALVRLPSPWGRITYWRFVVLLAVALPWLALDSSLGEKLRVSVISATGVGAAVAQSTNRFGAQPLRAIFSIAAAGAGLRLVWLAIGYARLRALRGRSTHATPSWDIDAMRRALAPRAAVRFVGGLAQPVAFGWQRPIVLLPLDIVDIPVDQQRAVVCHELLHVARRDWAWVWMEEAVRTVFWFHPAMRHAVSQIALGREEIVDAITVSHTGCRRAYMEALLRFATRHQGHLAGLTFVGSRHLRARMKALSKGSVMTRRRSAVTTAALMMWVAGTAVALAGTAIAPADQNIYFPGNGVSLPIVLKEVKPDYTDSAKQAKVHGAVMLDCVVARNGIPTDIVVTQSLDTAHGLDAEAVRALKQWRFRPGLKDRRPVAVKVSIEMTFTLR